MKTNLFDIAHCLEAENALQKYYDNLQIDLSGIEYLHIERRRQQDYHSAKVIPASAFLIDTLACDTEVLPEKAGEVTETSLNEVKSKLADFRISDELKTANELVRYFNWEWQTTEQGNKKLVPKNGQAKQVFLEHYTNAQKMAHLGNYVQRQYSFMLELNSSEPLGTAKTGNFPEFSGLDVDNLTLSFTSDNIHELVDNFNYQEVALADIGMINLFRMPKAKDSDLIVELKGSGDAISLIDIAKVGALLVMISRMHVKLLDAHVAVAIKTCEDEACAKNHKLNEYARMNAKLLENPNRELFSIYRDALHDDPEVKAAWDALDLARQLAVNPEFTLVRFEKHKLITLLAGALNYDEEEIANILGILCFNTSLQRDKERTSLNFQPIFEHRQQYCWLPNTLAFSSVTEMALQTLIGQKLVDISKLQSDLVESGFTALLRDHGFQIIQKPKRRKIKHPKTKQSVGDLDIAGIKEGHLYHFELKLTGLRNSFLEKHYLYNNFEDAGNRQLPNMKRYFKECHEDLMSRFGLPPDSKIKDVHQYIISNAVDFDHNSFNGHRKLTLLELMLHLKKDTFWITTDDVDWIKLMLIRIDKSKFTNVPPVFLQWAKDQGKLRDKKDSLLVYNFVKHYLPKLEEHESINDEHPLQCIDSNRLYGNLPTPRLELDYNVYEFEGVTYELPAILEFGE